MSNYIKSHVVFCHYSDNNLAQDTDPRFFCSYEAALAYILTELFRDLLTYMDNEEAIDRLWEMCETGEGMTAFGASTDVLREYDGEPYTEWCIYPLPGNIIDEALFAKLNSKEVVVALIDKYDTPSVREKTWASDEELLSAEEILETLSEEGYVAEDAPFGKRTFASSSDLAEISEDFWRIPVGDAKFNGAYIGRTKDGYLYIPFNECHDSTEGYEQLIVSEAYVSDAAGLQNTKDDIIDYCGALLSALTEAVEETRTREIQAGVVER